MEKSYRAIFREVREKQVNLGTLRSLSYDGLVEVGQAPNLLLPFALGPLRCQATHPPAFFPESMWLSYAGILRCI